MFNFFKKSVEEPAQDENPYYIDEENQLGWRGLKVLESDQSKVEEGPCDFLKDHRTCTKSEALKVIREVPFPIGPKPKSSEDETFDKMKALGMTHAFAVLRKRQLR